MNTEKTLLAQLTYRGSLRDIEVCLSAQSAKLYHLGLDEQAACISCGTPVAHFKFYGSVLHFVIRCLLARPGGSVIS